MTIRELIEKTPASIYIADGGDRCRITPWNIFYQAFKTCIVDTIDTTPDGDIIVTLKTELVRKEG